MAQNIKIGSYVGTGAAVNVSLGFEPDYIKIWNETDGDSSWEFFDGMTAAHALQSVNNAATQFSRITANGISRYAGDATNAEGFTAGSAVSEAAKTFRYLAIQNGE